MSWLREKRLKWLLNQYSLFLRGTDEKKAEEISMLNIILKPRINMIQILIFDGEVFVVLRIDTLVKMKMQKQWI